MSDLSRLNLTLGIDILIVIRHVVVWGVEVHLGLDNWLRSHVTLNSGVDPTICTRGGGPKVFDRWLFLSLFLSHLRLGGYHSGPLSFRKLWIRHELQLTLIISLNSFMWVNKPTSHWHLRCHFISFTLCHFIIWQHMIILLTLSLGVNSLRHLLQFLLLLILNILLILELKLRFICIFSLIWLLLLVCLLIDLLVLLLLVILMLFFL